MGRLRLKLNERLKVIVFQIQLFKDGFFGDSALRKFFDRELFDRELFLKRAS